jgi:hypothetical protein
MVTITSHGSPGNGTVVGADVVGQRDGLSVAARPTVAFADNFGVQLVGQ